ncbi:VOC family protein [Streptomyces buecherae]|uniref:VOC family protein n=1 Tax=Streptomyces buecherae TaxID=2763006 RepID=UPI001C26BFAC|nr:VOC family protein [Streptomyces buecherae]
MRMAFINLPVSDVKRSVEFFGQLGFEFNAEFSDEKTSCMIIEQNIFVMLLEEDRFKDFINGDIADAKRTTEVITCLSAESKGEVDDTVARAIAAGGKPWKPALQEGPMYGGSFQDLDGHVWELMYAAQA